MTRGLVVFPAVTVSVFLAPMLVGVVGTVLPSLGILPVLGGEALTLDPWRALLSAPGLGTAVRLSVSTGFAAALGSCLIAFGFCAAWHGSRWFGRLRGVLPPMLAIPHAAFAVGFALLVAPSGWIVRLLSPWATGWTRPPDIAVIQDPYGIALTVALICKEVPFLVLMILAALGQTRADALLASARSLGYGPVTAWIKVILPLVYPQVRLPVLAVLAYSLSAVEPALILAPATPPPLTPLILRWFADPDLSGVFRASAGAVLQLLLVAVGLGIWMVGERVVARCAASWLTGGVRGGAGGMARVGSMVAVGAAVLAAAGALLVLLIWSIARTWRFDEPLPGAWSLATALDLLPALWPQLRSSLAIAAAAVAIALVLAAGCLEHRRLASGGFARGALWILYLPLLVPAVGFLFGVQMVLVAWRLDGTWAAVVWAHLVYVLPYTILALGDPWAALDPRYERAARSLGHGRWRAFVRVRLPMLLRPVLTAAAIGFAVSVGQYLPTLFAGAGRVSTVTTEAVVLATGADRRVTAVYAFAQAALPLLGFAIAVLLPSWVYRKRSGMRAG